MPPFQFWQPEPTAALPPTAPATPTAPAVGESAPQIVFPDKMLVSEPQRYGQTSLYPVTLTANTDALAVVRPATTRTLLVLQVINANDVWVNFGAAAGVNNGMQLIGGTPGGVLFFDAVVPQDEIHLFSTGAAVVVVTVSEKAF